MELSDRKQQKQTQLNAPPAKYPITSNKEKPIFKRNKSNKIEEGYSAVDSELSKADISLVDRQNRIDPAEKTRLKLKKFYATSLFGRVYDRVLLILSILSCMEYIYGTYLHAHKRYQIIQLTWFGYFEMGLAFIFGCDWLLFFFLADRKIKFITSFYSMIDLLTIIPIWVSRYTTCPAYSSIDGIETAVIYVLCGLNPTRIMRALRIRKQLVTIEDAVDRALGEMILTISVMLLFNAALMQYLEAEIQPFHYHTWTYYLWVTTATVGYGDIAPKSDLGRVACMGMICFAIIQVPKMTNDLLDKMKLQSIYARLHHTQKVTADTISKSANILACIAYPVFSLE